MGAEEEDEVPKPNTRQSCITFDANKWLSVRRWACATTEKQPHKPNPKTHKKKKSRWLHDLPIIKSIQALWYTRFLTLMAKASDLAKGGGGF